MTIANLITKHDYCTLRVRFTDGQTFSFTRSRNGASMRGTAATKSALAFLDKWTDQFATVGEAMRRMQATAKITNTMYDFLERL